MNNKCSILILDKIKISKNTSNDLYGLPYDIPLSKPSKKYKIPYDKLDFIFEYINNIITSPNIECWYCRCNLSNIDNLYPITIPQSIESNIRGNITKFTPSGIFDSFRCAYSWIIMNYSNNRELFSDYYDRLKIYYKFMYNKPPPTFIEALNPTSLRKCGGCISDIDFQKKNT